MLDPSWSRGGFRPKNYGSGTRFSGNLEKSILRHNLPDYVYKIIVKKSSIFHLKYRGNIKFRFYKFSNILPSEVEGEKCVNGLMALMALAARSEATSSKYNANTFCLSFWVFVWVNSRSSPKIFHLNMWWVFAESNVFPIKC